MPVLADAGTAVAARAGRAVRAAAWAFSGGRGDVGTPARAARPRDGASVRRGGIPAAVLSSTVRMARPFGRRSTEEPPARPPARPAPLRLPDDGGGHRVLWRRP